MGSFLFSSGEKRTDRKKKTLHQKVVMLYIARMKPKDSLLHTATKTRSAVKAR